MASNPQEELRVRGVLAAYGLPDKVGAFDFGQPAAGLEGSYHPQIDTCRLPMGAGDQTIIHEGSHAWHYSEAGLIGGNFPANQDTAVGAVILSEAYIGVRLANANGFLAYERAALAGFPNTAIKIAERFILVPDARGTPVAMGGHFIAGDVMTVMLFRFVLRILPLVAAEVTTQQAVFTAGLSATSTHPNVLGTGVILLNVLQDVIGVLNTSAALGPVTAGLVSVPNMSRVGSTFMDSMRKAGVV